MKVDAEIALDAPADAGRLGKRAEELGFDGFWVNETKHDPFLQLTLAAGATRSIEVGTSIALAFTRSPTTLAHSAWDLQSISAGRLILGLGSQVKGHIERRFGMKFEPPAPKMREEVLAIKAVWNSWQTGEKLDFQGRFFKLDLMTPFFSPGPIEEPRIPIFVAGVNPLMCRVAGEVADGLHVHPLHTARYLREVVIPALGEGAAKSGRRRADLSVAAAVFVALGDTREEVRKSKEELRSQVAFYASTRTYRKVLELHGWGDLCDRLHELSVRGEWQKMGSVVDDDVLDEVVVEGSWSDVGARIRDRYGGMVDRVRLYIPFDGGENWRSFAKTFRA